MLNDYYQNIGMKGFIQRYGIVNAVKRGAFMFIKLHLVKDYEVRKVLSVSYTHLTLPTIA